MCGASLRRTQTAGRTRLGRVRDMHKPLFLASSFAVTENERDILPAAVCTASRVPRSDRLRILPASAPEVCLK